MTTSRATPFLYKTLYDETIPAGELAYFRARLGNRLHALIVSEFVRLRNSGELTQAQLAKRIGREPAQITRWLGAPGNWTIDTVSDLLLAVGCELSISASHVSSLAEEPTNSEQDSTAREPLTVAAANDEQFKLRGSDYNTRLTFGFGD